MHRTFLKVFSKVGRKISKHGRLILTVTSIIGLGESVYLTAKVTPIANDALLKAKLHKGEELTIKEKIKSAGPIYAPVAGSVAITGGLIIFNHRLGTKRINKALGAAIAARKAYMSLASDFTDYKQIVEDQFGADHAALVEGAVADKKFEDISPQFSKDKIQTAPGHEKQGAMLCWIPRLDYDLRGKKAGDFFWATELELGDVEGKMNKHFQEYGWVDIDIFRDYFGLPREKASWGYNMRCQCFSERGGKFDREDDWIQIDKTYGSIQGVWCTILDYDRRALCDIYKCACCGDNDIEDCQLLPFK